MNVWGIHNDTLTNELIDESFVSIGWDELGDLNEIGGGREGLKLALSESKPEAKPRSIAVQAGMLLRFRDSIKVGDIVIAPFKPDSTINIGEIVGLYEYQRSADTHRHRRKVRWRKLGVPRTVFTQPALYEIGSFLTIFQVRKHSDEFLAVLRSGSDSAEEAAQAVGSLIADEVDDGSSDEPRASRIDRHTRDFVLTTLHREISHREFEEFTADLLRAMGYQARVTQYAQDGGVDVIAHRDLLGLEPPLVKVQCKHLTSTISAPDVQRLVGTQGPNELSLFVTLGTYSRDALAIERQRSGLRLLTGEDVVTLMLEHYSKMPDRWKTLIPLTSVLVVADSADNLLT